MQILRRIWEWIKKICAKMYSMFKADIKKKKETIRTTSPADVVRMLKGEVFHFFASGLKKYAIAQLQPQGSLQKALSCISLPYEGCWDFENRMTTPLGLETLTIMLKHIGTTVWSGEEDSWVQRITLRLPLTV